MSSPRLNQKQKVDNNNIMPNTNDMSYEVMENLDTIANNTKIVLLKGLYLLLFPPLPTS